MTRALFCRDLACWLYETRDCMQSNSCYPCDVRSGVSSPGPRTSVVAARGKIPGRAAVSFGWGTTRERCGSFKSARTLDGAALGFAATQPLYQWTSSCQPQFIW